MSARQMRRLQSGNRELGLGFGLELATGSASEDNEKGEEKTTTTPPLPVRSKTKVNPYLALLGGGGSDSSSSSSGGGGGGSGSDGGGSDSRSSSDCEEAEGGGSEGGSGDKKKTKKHTSAKATKTTSKTAKAAAKAPFTTDGKEGGSASDAVNSSSTESSRRDSTSQATNTNTNTYTNKNKKKKKKKNKNKKKGAATTATATTTTTTNTAVTTTATATQAPAAALVSEDEIDAAIREVREQHGETTFLNEEGEEEGLGTQDGGGGGSDGSFLTVEDARNLFGVERRFLNADAEMQRRFGSQAVRDHHGAAAGALHNHQHRAAAGRRGGRGAAAAATRARRTSFATPKGNWPPISRTGISMGVDSSSSSSSATRAGSGSGSGSGVTWFRINHSKAYGDAQMRFLRAVRTLDQGAVASVTRTHPYHLATLLTLAEAQRAGGDLPGAGDCIERALHCIECGTHALFNSALASGEARMSYAHHPNRAVFLALFRHISLVAGRGCWRSAFEHCRMLLALNPRTDPMGALLLLDYHALRCGQASYLVRLVAEWGQARTLDWLPNMAFSSALALYMQAQERAKDAAAAAAPDNDNGSAAAATTSIDQRQQDRSQYLYSEADEALRLALVRFPSLFTLLTRACRATVDKDTARHALFAMPDPSNMNASERAVHLLCVLYTERAHTLWRPAGVMGWLLQCARAVVAQLVDEEKKSMADEQGGEEEEEEKERGEKNNSGSDTASNSTRSAKDATCSSPTTTTTAAAAAAALPFTTFSASSSTTTTKSSSPSSSSSPLSAQVTAAADRRRSHYPRIPLNVQRHVLMSEIPACLSLLPAETTREPWLAHDPLPPRAAGPDPYEERLKSEAYGGQSYEGGALSAFLRSILPTFNPGAADADAVAAAAGLDGVGAGGVQAPAEFRAGPMGVRLREMLQGIDLGGLFGFGGGGGDGGEEIQGNAEAEAEVGATAAAAAAAVGGGREGRGERRATAQQVEAAMAEMAPEDAAAVAAAMID